MSNKITVNPPQVQDFKGTRTLALNPNGRASITFGLGKGMVIRENFAAVLAFLKSDGANCEPSKELSEAFQEFLTKHVGDK